MGAWNHCAPARLGRGSGRPLKLIVRRLWRTFYLPTMSTSRPSGSSAHGTNTTRTSRRLLLAFRSQLGHLRSRIGTTIIRITGARMMLGSSISPCGMPQAASVAPREWLQIVARFLGAYHDGFVEIAYTNVTRHELTRGAGDWLYDEIRLSEDGAVLHEIEFDGGHWLIECSDITARWIPVV